MSCRMKTRRRIGGGLAVGLLAAAISHGATAKDLKTISMIYFNGSSESVEVGLMVDEILERNGLKPEFAKATSGPAITSALASGSVQFGPGYQPSICPLLSRTGRYGSLPPSQHPSFTTSLPRRASTLLTPASA